MLEGLAGFLVERLGAQELSKRGLAAWQLDGADCQFCPGGRVLTAGASWYGGEETGKGWSVYWCKALSRGG